jgi:hypothetical protein
MVTQRLLYFDGLAVAAQGDLLLVYYFGTPTIAHLERLEAFADCVCREHGERVIYAQVIGDEHRLPSKETQQWAVGMTERLAPRARTIISYPKGDSFRSISIRSVLNEVSTDSRKRQHIVDWQSEFVAAIALSRTELTPGTAAINALIREMEAAHEGSQHTRAQRAEL